MKAKKIILSSVLGLFVAFGMMSCHNGKADKMQATIDSLSTSDSLHQEDIKQMADFVNVMSVGLDSISAQEGLIKQMGSREGQMDKTQMRAQLQSLAELLRKQRARINELEAEVARNNNLTRKTSRSQTFSSSSTTRTPASPSSTKALTTSRQATRSCRARLPARASPSTSRKRLSHSRTSRCTLPS